jgi:hypothetical protein
MSGIAQLLLDAGGKLALRRAAMLTRAAWIMRDHAPFINPAGSVTMLKQKSSEYRGYRTAGIRLSEEQLPQLAHPTARGRSRCCRRSTRSTRRTR